MVNGSNLFHKRADDLLIGLRISTGLDLVSDLQSAGYCIPDFARLSHRCYSHFVVDRVEEPIWLDDWFVGDAVRAYCHVPSRPTQESVIQMYSTCLKDPSFEPLTHLVLINNVPMVTSFLVELLVPMLAAFELMTYSTSGQSLGKLAMWSCVAWEKFAMMSGVNLYHAM